MRDLLKQILRPPYRFVKNIAIRTFLMLRPPIVKFLLPRAYREELTFFENIRSRRYKDQEYSSKKIRMLTHWVDKTFTLSKKINKATTARQVEEMLRDTNKNRESDRITCQWAYEVLDYYNKPKKNFIEEKVAIQPHAADILSNIIKTRRSIRSYKSQKIEDPVLFKILEAGLWAPSGCNRQPIEYLIIDDGENVFFCQKYAGECCTFPQEASINIVILVDPRGYALPHQRHMAYLEAGAAIQNILLTAHSLGLGSCWMFWAKYDQAFNKKFGLLPWLLPVGLVCIGYADRLPPIVPKRKCVLDCIHDVRKKD